MILESLSAQRSFNIFIPDITLAEAQKNEPYVLRISVPAGSQFLGVVQIASPLAGLGALAGNPQIAYAFLCDPESEERRNVYITAVFSEMSFPWHTHTEQATWLKKHGGLFEERHPQRAFCAPLGLTSHNGVPLLHVRVDVSPDDYEEFEKELVENHYRIVPAKPYTQSEALINLYKQSARAASPANPGEVGS